MCSSDLLGGDALAAVPPPAGVDLHRCRWDQAWALARLLPEAEMPQQVTLILVEARGFDPGTEPSAEVARGIEDACLRIAALLRAEADDAPDISAAPSAR